MDGRLTAEDLAKLVELEKTATPGPWSAEPGEYVHTGWTVVTARGEGMTPSSPLAVIGKISNLLGEDEAMKEAALIAAARNALPTLLASAAAAQVARVALEKAAGWFGDYADEHHTKTQRFEQLGMHADAAVARTKGGTNAARAHALREALAAIETATKP
ncbi:MAG: hypothetical protein B7Z41_09725 [Rhizobiales bacterium 12-66-7]|nr:MAG: hypothetical protein B7Z41_09725 [Rhizobiales bacterium 12-66-7]